MSPQSSGQLAGTFFSVLLTLTSTIALWRTSLAAQLVKNLPAMQETPVRSLGWEEGIGYPLQYSWASLVAQLVKNLPAKQETWVWSLGWKDPLEKGRLSIPVFWPGHTVHGVVKSRTWLSLPLWLLSEITLQAPLREAFAQVLLF